ncbi:protease inhibitor I42 family protein [Chloroflexota bacterium]
MELKLTQTDNGKSIEIQQEDVIKLSLKENPSTGYRWTVDKSSDEALVLQSSEFVSPENPKFGEGGVRVFEFRENKAVTTHIQLKHWREWEGDTSIIDRFAVTLLVKD